MFHIIPLRTSLLRAGWGLLTLSLAASYLGACADRLTSPGITLAPPANARSWLAIAVVYLGSFGCGWLGAREMWPKWRDRRLVRPDTIEEAPATRVRWTWTMKQMLAGALLIVVGIWLAVLLAETGADENRIIVAVAVALGTLGVTYLMLARRVGRLEQDRGVVYYWQRQPGILSFERVGVYTVPAYAVLW